MDFCLERNIVEIKNEYSKFLTNILSPLLFEGIKAIYKEALVLEKQFIDGNKKDGKITNPGIFKIFQILLNDVQKLNKYSIEREATRIKVNSKCDWLLDLIKATIKSYIVLLTFNTSEGNIKLVNEKYHTDIDYNLFIHKCYIECSKVFYNNPELFWHKYDTLNIKKNQREAIVIINDAIIEAIRKILPIKQILEEYNNKVYVQEKKHDVHDVKEYIDVQSMIERDVNDKEKKESDSEHARISEEKKSVGGSNDDANTGSGSNSKSNSGSNSGSNSESKSESSSIETSSKKKNKIIDSDDSEIDDQIDELENYDLKDIILGKKETNLDSSSTMATVNSLRKEIDNMNDLNTEEQLKRLKSNPNVVFEPLNIRNKQGGRGIMDGIDQQNRYNDVNVVINKKFDKNLYDTMMK